MSNAAIKEKANEDPQAGLPKPKDSNNTEPLPKPGDANLSAGDKKFRGGNLQPYLAEFSSAQYVIHADDAHTREDVTRPGYWANVAQKFKPCDELKIYFNGEQPGMLHLVVVDCGMLWAKMKILNWYDFSDEAQAALGLHMADAVNDYTVYHKGGQAKWVVARKSDKALLQSGLPDRGSANAWLDEYKKTLLK